MGRITPLAELGIVIAAVAICCCCGTIQNVDAHPQGLAFVNHQGRRVLGSSSKSNSAAVLCIPRGGAKIVDDDEDEYEDEYDEYDEEEEEQINIKSLKSSTLKASSKAKKQKASSTKKVVSDSLSSSSSKKTKTVTAKVKKTKRTFFHIPYILKAMLNPFTVIAMTKGYFASLFNIDYLQEDTTQTLRSALQEKAKKQAGQSGGSAKKPGRGRKMKPGQAKTLSDLPQLNA